jgi:hypothetical protein
MGPLLPPARGGWLKQAMEAFDPVHAHVVHPCMPQLHDAIRDLALFEYVSVNSPVVSTFNWH